MKYRVAKTEDLLAITNLINGSGYYAPMSAAELDGVIVVAEHDGELKGCIWAMICGRHAFLDYFVVKPGNGRVALMLPLVLEKLLVACGVKYVRTNISSENTSALRVARAAGMVASGDYHLAYKRLTDGNEERD